VPSACSKLQAAGYTVIGGGNAASFNHNTSVVLVQQSSIADAAEGDRVASVLGLAKGDVGVPEVGQNVADVLVILGRDFKP
jgi:hypothetical protein